MTANQVSKLLGQFSQVFYEFSTYESFSVMLRHVVSKSSDFRRHVANPMGLTFGDGNPNVLMSVFGHMPQKQMQHYTSEHGQMASFTSELVISYLYQYWENETRPQIESILSKNIASDVFGDLRLIRNILQHERHKHIADTKKAAQLKMFFWIRNKATALLTGDAFNAIAYSIGLELNRLNKLVGNPAGDISGLPSFFEGASHFGLLSLNTERMTKLAKLKWYKTYVLDTSMSSILSLEKETLGELH
jgi:hypothetical protein